MATTDSGKQGEKDVFGSLPSSRPQRRSAKRSTATKTPKAKAAAKPKPKAAAKAKPKAKPRAAAKPKPKAAPAPKPRSTVPPAGYATPRPDEVPSGRGDLLGTAVQAAGEIAQIGVAASARAINSALKRLPRP